MHSKTVLIVMACLVPLATVVVFLDSESGSNRQSESVDGLASEMKDARAEATREESMTQTQREAALSQLPPNEPTPDTGTVVFIGEYRDPNDPHSWQDSQDSETIFIGEYRDPDDPASSSSQPDEEAVVIGPYLDPDNPMSWPQTGDGERVQIGEYRDPEDPQTWSPGTGGPARIIGEYRNPDVLDAALDTYAEDE